MDMINDNFGIDFRSDCIMFKYNKSTYKIPSKIYPLNGRRYSIFHNENTVEIDNDEIKRLFNMCKFEIGMCYSNTEMIRQGAEMLDINNIKYYSGWVFMDTEPPMHHAWIVYNNSVLDGGILKDLYTMFNNVDIEKLDKRKHAELMKKSLLKNIPNNEKFCFGKVIKPLIYVGCEDDYQHAKLLYRKAIEVTKGKHPSSRNPADKPYQYSETQKMIKGLL